jgi:hypothetical protein
MATVDRRTLLIPFLVGGLAYLASWAAGYRTGELVTRPALLLVLALYVLTARWDPQRPPAGLLLATGLVFAAAGDTASLPTGAVALLDRVVLFLVAPGCYLLSRRRRWTAPAAVGSVLAALAIAVRLALGIGTALVALIEALNGLRIVPAALTGGGYAVMGLYAGAQLLIAVVALGLIRRPGDLDTIRGQG